MKKWIIWAFVVMVACESADTFETTETGLRYQVIREGEGDLPVNNDVMLLHFRYDDANGNVMYNTAERGGPAPVIYHDSLATDQESVEDIFHLLHKGDSVLLKMNAAKLFTNTFKQPLPDSIEAESDITFYIGVEEIMNQEDFNAYRMAQAKQQQEEQAMQAEQQLLVDIEIIEQYLADNNLEAVKTESGLHYIIHEEGTGPKPEYNDVVDVHYKGYLLDGTVFDTSYEEIARESGVYREGRQYAPYPLSLRPGGAIDGWVEGIGYFSEGTKATMIVPSVLAYGPADGGVFGPNSVLAFDVEIVKVTPSQQ